MRTFILILTLGLVGCAIPKVTIEREILNAEGTDCLRHPVTRLCLKEKVKMTELAYIATEMDFDKDPDNDPCVLLAQNPTATGADVRDCNRDETLQAAFQALDQKPQSPAMAALQGARDVAVATREAQKSMGTAALGLVPYYIIGSAIKHAGDRNTVTNNVNGSSKVSPGGEEGLAGTGSNQTGPTSINTVIGQKNNALGENNGTFTLEQTEDFAVNRPNQQSFEAPQEGNILTGEGDNTGVSLPFAN